VPYLEAIRGRARAQGRYKKQTGGRGQFGDCHIELEPMPGHEGYEFVDRIVGGVIPQSYRPAVDRGVQETMATGELAGYPIVGVRVTLVDGSYHAVDSSEQAFKTAAAAAFRKAFEAARPALLEPIVALEITVPAAKFGDITADLSTRRGHITGMDTLAGGQQVIQATAPLSEVLRYATDLKSLTGGQGSYTMEFLSHEPVPPNVQQTLCERWARSRAGVEED